MSEETFNFEEEIKPEIKPPKKTKTYPTDRADEEVIPPSAPLPIPEISEKDNTIRWNSRRRMAWIALISMVIVTFLMLFVVDSSKLSSLEIVISWFYMGCVSIVGSYMGFTTYAAIKGLRER